MAAARPSNHVRAWLATGFMAILAVIRAIWRLFLGQPGPFVTLHVPPDSATLRKAPDAAGHETSFAELLQEKIPALGPDAKFDRVWWLPGGDAQTMFCSVRNFSNVDPVIYERKYLRLPDGGVVGVDITPPLSTRPLGHAENVLLVAHGLTGGSYEAYIRAVLSKVTPGKEDGGMGFRAVVLNFRGCNGSPILTPRLYHAGSSDDIRHVALWISQTFPECRMYGIGFSLGANILAKYAGEEGERCPLLGLVTLANPWNFTAGAHHLPFTFLGKHVYQYALGGALRALLHLHRRTLFEAAELPVPHATLRDFFRRRWVTLRQFDEIVTAPLYGFEDAWEYYRQISSCKVAPDLRIPTLAINSLDDPITGGAKSLPFHEVAQSPYLILAATQGGGHLGWFEHSPRGGIGRWYVKPVEQFLAALVEYGLQERPKPLVVTLGPEHAHEAGRPEVGFRVLSREQSELIASGVDKSKLFTGW